MNISKRDIDAAIQAKIITKSQAAALCQFLESQQPETPSFHLSHLLYYLGGLIAVLAITLFITNAWEAMRGGMLLTLFTFLFILGLSLTQYFQNCRLSLPAGLMAVFSLVVVPLAIFNAQIFFGYFPKASNGYVIFHDVIDWRLTFMEVSTLVTGIILFYIYRTNLIILALSVLAWLISLDFYHLYLQDYHSSAPSWSFGSEFANFNLIFGLVMTTLAIYVDFKIDERTNYAGWIYMVGVIIFWVGLRSQLTSSEISELVVCLINLLLIFCSAMLNRRIFAVAGILGILLYLGHLSTDVFANSLGYPLALVLLGITILFIARFYTSYEKKIQKLLLPITPHIIVERMQE